MPSVTLIQSPPVVLNPKIAQKMKDLDSLLLTYEGRQQIEDFIGKELRKLDLDFHNDSHNLYVIERELKKTEHPGGILLRKLISKTPRFYHSYAGLGHLNVYINRIAYMYTTCYSGHSREITELIDDLDKNIKNYVAVQKAKLQRVGVLRRVIQGFQKKTAAIKAEGAFVQLLRKASKSVGKLIKKRLKFFK